MKLGNLVLVISTLFLTACGGGGSGGANANGGGVAAPPPAANQPPSADAGADTAVEEGAAVPLVGSGADGDGTIAGYQWVQVSGVSVTIVDAGTADASFVAPFVISDQTPDTSLVFRLTVADDDGGTASDTVSVRVLDSVSAQADDQAMTQQGVVEGAIENGLRVFKGVRYAAAPIGNLRFQPPVAAPFAGGVTEAKAVGPACIQELFGGIVGAEDCLFLNIWAPQDDQAHPVIVFLHGGGQNSPVTDGANLAASSDAVVVTLHRRVGVMGSLALQELVDESPRQTAGNYSILDVIAALQWVQRNIAEFHGDPQQVLLAGESAGARLMCHLVAAPEASGLFQSMAFQSAGCRSQFVLNDSIAEFSPFAPALGLHLAIVGNAGCAGAADRLACLRGRTAVEIVQAAQAVPLINGNTSVFDLLIDGEVVVSNPYDALLNQVAGDVPMIVGSTKDESRNLLAIPIADDNAYRSFLNNAFGPKGPALYDLYPTADFDAALDAFHAFFTDFLFSCVAEQLADSASANRPAYLYQFTRGLAAGEFAGHAVDVPHLFETLPAFGVVPDQVAQDISTAMQTGWRSLAAAPNLAPVIDAAGAGNLMWPAYSPQAVQVFEFGESLGVAAEHRDGKCPQLAAILAP